ncbi:MAG: hypothetical protein JWN23_2395 [Rhodocyclales bacterium]|nr:hypothetical protein [Rhodocyclales bacterium]
MKKIVAMAALTVLSLPAFAGRPLTTDDAGVIEKGGFELENYYHSQTQKDTARISGFHTQPSVGIGFNTQLGIAADFLRADNEEFGERKSSGQFALVGKTSIKELTDDNYGVAVGYSLDHTRAPGESYRYDNVAAYGVVTVPVDKWLFHANLGWARSHLAAISSTTWAIAAERTGAFGPIDLAVETYGNDRDPAWLQVAARWVVKEDRLFIDASYGEQLSSVHTKLLTIGLKLAY